MTVRLFFYAVRAEKKLQMELTYFIGDYMIDNDGTNENGNEVDRSSGEAATRAIEEWDSKIEGLPVLIFSNIFEITVMKEVSIQTTRVSYTI